MRRFIILILVATAMTGCRKMMDKLEKQGADSASDIPAGGGGTMAMGGGGGGSGGAVQAVRKRVERSKVEQKMHQLHLFMMNAKGALGRTPTSQETMNEISQPSGDRELVKMIEDQEIFLIPNPGDEGLWAYSKYAFDAVGPVVTSGGVETAWTSQQLNQAFQNMR